MGKDGETEIGPERLDAVLRFLPVFEQEGYSFGRWVTAEGQLPWFEYSAGVSEFTRTLYEQNLIVSFDWMSWSEEVRRYQSGETALATADLQTICKLLTAHVRADRFSEGHLAEVLQAGHTTALLRRLREIRDTMAGGLSAE